MPKPRQLGLRGSAQLGRLVLRCAARALIGRRARAQQQAPRVRPEAFFEEGAQLPLASVALAAGLQSTPPVRLAQPVTLVIERVHSMANPGGKGPSLGGEGKQVSSPLHRPAAQPLIYQGRVVRA